MNTLHLDFETRSTVDLKITGAHVYAGHSSTGVWCMAYAFNDGAIAVWRPGEEPPPLVVGHVEGGHGVVAHNVNFEWCIWNAILVPRYGFPPLKIEQCYCTMAMAGAMALPRDLGGAAAAVGLDAQKDMEGRRLMLQMARPRKIDGDEITWWDDAPRLERLVAYCRQDVETERQLEKRLLSLSAQERRVWLLDHKINNRGVGIDLGTIGAAEKVVELAAARLDRRMMQVTFGAVSKCSKVRDLVDWLRSRGIDGDSVAKAELAALLERGNLPADVRQALEIRQEAAKTSTAKLAKMRGGASRDGRARGLFLYGGANTGRWTGARVQPHNLPRPSRSFGEIEDVIRVLGEVA